MLFRYRCLLLLLCGFPCLTVAFGPRFEPVKYGARTNRQVFAENENEEEHQNLVSQQRSYSLHYENRYEEIDGEYFQSRLFISEPFILDASVFGIINPYDKLTEGEDDDAFAACGEDCEECAIPEEYKLVENPIDVMAYLGIRRAEAIRVVGNNFSAGNWE